MVGLPLVCMSILIPQENWDYFETNYKSEKITERKTNNEQTQECESRLNILDQVSPVLHAKCPKMSWQSHIKYCRSVI